MTTTGDERRADGESGIIAGEKRGGRDDIQHLPRPIRRIQRVRLVPDKSIAAIGNPHVAWK